MVFSWKSKFTTTRKYILGGYNSCATNVILDLKQTEVLIYINIYIYISTYTRWKPCQCDACDSIIANYENHSNTNKAIFREI